jgi:hypothetical protein
MFEINTKMTKTFESTGEPGTVLTYGKFPFSSLLIMPQAKRFVIGFGLEFSRGLWAQFGLECASSSHSLDKSVAPIYIALLLNLVI